MPGAIVLAGAGSGTGKTTFAAGIIAAFRSQGLRVQPFKVGPDYLDPTYHSLAAGSGFPSRNLDTWMLPPANLLQLYRRAAAKADLAVIEGVMGLYDGKNGQTEEGSTASLAKLLGVPVIAVLDIGKISRTAGAIALGLQKFDPGVPLKGFLLNRAGSETHYEWCKQAVEEATGLPVLGWLPKNPEWALPERHLGLVPAGEQGRESETSSILQKLAAEISRTVDLTRLEKIAACALQPPVGENRTSSLFPELPIAPFIRLGLAQDEAFAFYYRDNLDLLEAWGAEIVPFSPLEDQSLPPSLDGLYIGGGFPEIFAARLSQNRELIASLKMAAAAGIPIYAECGGLMYLSRELADFDGKIFPMAGLLPYKTAMQNRRVKIGYAEAFINRAGHPFGAAGTVIRSHEFHWSQLEGEFEPGAAAYILPQQSNRPEGWLKDNVLASYLHLHFGSDARLAPALLKWCAGFKAQNPGKIK